MMATAWMARADHLTKFRKITNSCAWIVADQIKLARMLVPAAGHLSWLKRDLS
jgi:hypothetical protein